LTAADLVSWSATILGDGQIALILDPVVLAREASIEQREAAGASDAVASARSAEGASSEQMLIVRLQGDVKAAIPLEQVRRLEEFPTKQIERVGANTVIQYRGSILPLIDVAAAMGNEPDAWSSGHVVVVGSSGMLVGLQVQEILDVSSEVSAVRPVQGKPGITSYGVIQGKVIALLDVAHFVAHGLGGSALPVERVGVAV